VDTMRMEQQLQAGSNTLARNQGDGEIISVGGRRSLYSVEIVTIKPSISNPSRPGNDWHSTGSCPTQWRWAYLTRLGVDTPQACMSRERISRVLN
jgi:hypothetical protein